MSAVHLNDAARLALRYMQLHRAKMRVAKGRDADDAREQVRSYAVEVVNEILREHPELGEVQP